MKGDIKGQNHNILKGYNMLLYFAGTMIMYEPAEECIVDFWREGILKKLPVSSSNPLFVKAAGQLRESCTDQSSNTVAMCKDYFRLFKKEEMPLAPYYESFYKNRFSGPGRSKDSGVTEFYNSFGWKPKFRNEMRDDHLGVELLFLTTLVERYMHMDDEACRVEMRNEIRRFIDNHILTWIPEWYQKVQDNSLTLSYKGISSLIYASVEDIHSFLSNRNEIVRQPYYSKN
ncbi:MAG TPA: molecular chaperone TorD family protein [Bacteroidales bacterium]|nr:molecular chaperone TorD family protein [Bacteroidales bacterium]